MLGRVKDRLLSVRRPEQSGFTPKRSTVDRIALLNLLLQGRREHSRPLRIAYVDLRAASDSVDHTALWLLLQSIGIPPKLIDMLKDLYADTVSCVRLNGALSDWFHFGSGVRRGCAVAPSLFLLPVGWVLRRVVRGGFLGAMLGAGIFADLDYADDVALLAEMLEVFLLALDVLNDEARPLGLGVGWQRAKIQSTIDSTATPSSVYISGNPVEVVESFVYLGSEIHSSGSSEPEVLRRTGLAKSCFNLMNRGIWRSSISVLTKVQLYCTYIQPVLLYGSETWALT